MANGHGGKRPNAGRKTGQKDRATIEQRGTIEELARSHSDVAIETLVQIAQASDSDAARVSAANALLDRGYGKARQFIDASVSVTLGAALDELDE